MFGVVESFAREHLGFADVRESKVVPLRGGLETCSVARVLVRGAGKTGERRSYSLVIKTLTGSGLRELEIHQAAERASPAPLTPRLLGWSDNGSGTVYVFLEWINARRWPWRDVETAALVLEQLARVHSWDPPVFVSPRFHWDYEADLRDSAASTVEVLARAGRSGALSFRASPRPVEALIENLPAIRRQISDFSGLCLIHGDAHPGNAMIRQSAAPRPPVLLDWARARLGSPLEDVSSWLQSLGFWEFEAMRAHDSLVRRYLNARDAGARITTQFREAYWLAGASNALAGALRYHLAVVLDPERGERQRYESGRAAADWLRIIRRARASWKR